MMHRLACATTLSIVAASGGNAARHHPPSFIAAARRAHHRNVLCAERSHSADLDTAYEWLAEDRVLNEPERHGIITWFDPSAISSRTDVEDGTEIVRMPLYPLGAVHMPHSGENYTIVNIEPKNVKMATDLVNGEWEGALFCASLRARDTNRIASVGTVMQLLDTEDRSISGARTWPGNVLPTMNRVVANCKAVGVVDIVAIEGREYREGDYLIAKVKVRSPPNESKGDTDATTTEASGLVEDYQTIRSIYVNSQSLSQNELPKFARNAVQTLPTFDADIVDNEAQFWKLIETWQMLCNTIRQSKRTQLQGIVNELSVSVAMQSKGPLELPVKRKNLPLDVQRQLDGIEQNAARDFLEMGMDPVLDFQEMLGMEQHKDRVKKLAGLVKRERSRLEAKESLIRAFLGEEFAADERNSFN
ncbi:hypothetical protein ACHAXT_006732 [Thalassiosira profunda]